MESCMSGIKISTPQKSVVDQALTKEREDSRFKFGAAMVTKFYLTKIHIP